MSRHTRSLGLLNPLSSNCARSKLNSHHQLFFSQSLSTSSIHQAQAQRQSQSKGHFRLAAGQSSTISVKPADTRPKWSSLSPVDKVVRTTQQSINFGLILLGIALTSSIGYILYDELLAPSGPIRVFNAALNRVKADKRCVEALAGNLIEREQEHKTWWQGGGGGNRNSGQTTSEDAWKKAVKYIYAHGESSHSRWTRNRTVTDASWTDSAGVEHVRMQFYLQAGGNKGVCRLHVTRIPGLGIRKLVSMLINNNSPDSTTSESIYSARKWFGTSVEYQYLYLDVPGHERIVLEGKSNAPASSVPKVPGEITFLGVKWR